MISPPESDSTSADDLDVYDVSVDSDPLDPLDVDEGTGSDHFLDVFSPKDPVLKKYPDPAFFLEWVRGE